MAMSIMDTTKRTFLRSSGLGDIVPESLLELVKLLDDPGAGFLGKVGGLLLQSALQVLEVPSGKTGAGPEPGSGVLCGLLQVVESFLGVVPAFTCSLGELVPAVLGGALYLAACIFALFRRKQ